MLGNFFKNPITTLLGVIASAATLSATIIANNGVWTWKLFLPNLLPLLFGGVSQDNKQS